MIVGDRLCGEELSWVCPELRGQMHAEGRALAAMLRSFALWPPACLAGDRVGCGKLCVSRERPC